MGAGAIRLKTEEEAAGSCGGVPRVKGTHSGLDRGARGEPRDQQREKTEPSLLKPSSFQHHLIRPSDNANCVNKDFGPLPGKFEFHPNGGEVR